MLEANNVSIGDFTAVSLVIFLLVLALVVPVHFTFSSQTVEEEQFPQNIIASSSTDTTPHFLNLKATQQGDAEPVRVSGFKLDMTNVVTAQVNSQLLVFVTDSSVRITETKVKTVSDRLIDLVPSSQANTFSLANLPVGVYTLDVITQKGNTKAAYEGILVIGQQPRTIINEIINRETNENGDVIIILPPGNITTPTPTPTPTLTPTGTPAPSPELTPSPEPTPELTPGLAPEPSPEPTPLPNEGLLPFDEQPTPEDEEPVTPFKKWYDEQYDEQPPPEDEQPPDEGDTNGNSDEENGDTDESEGEGEGDRGGDEGESGDEQGEDGESGE